MLPSKLLIRSVTALCLLTGVARGQSLSIGLSADPDTLDPALSGSYYSRNIFMAMCDKLFDVNEKLQIVPQLATSYEWADPKTLVIHLRPIVLFQDGEKMDAASVKYTLERNLTLRGSYRRAEISAIDHVDVVDPLTVRIVLKSPDSPLVAQLADRAGMIIAPNVARQEGSNFGLHPVCTGPFAFKERVAQDHTTLTRFAGYWDAKDIHFDSVTYQTLPNGSVRLANLQAGALDIVDQIVPTDVPIVQRNPRLTVIGSDSLGYDSLVWNVANGPQANSPAGRLAAVRQAFELGLDRQALNQVVYAGLFTPDAQAMPTDSPFYIASMPPPARDVAKAKALLRRSGVKTPIAVNFVIQNDPLLQQAAEVIQSMEAEIGFAVHITPMEAASSLPAGQAGQFQLFTLYWSGRIDPDGNLYPFLYSSGPFNYGHWNDPAADKALDEARETTDLQKRRALYTQVYQQVAAQAPLIYLLNPHNLPGMKKTITGFRPVPDGLIRLQGLARQP